MPSIREVLRGAAAAPREPLDWDRLRRLSRRRRIRMVTSLCAVALVVAGTSVGAVITFRASTPIPPGYPTPTAPATPPPLTGPTHSQTSEPPASAEPPPSTQGVAPPGCGGDQFYQTPAYPYAGQALPTSLMLSASDWRQPCIALVYDAPGYSKNDPNLSWPSPAVCWGGRSYATHEHRMAGRFRIFVGGAEFGGSESVTRYAPGKAAEFLDEVRSHVRSCAVQNIGDGQKRYAFIAQTGFAGDDSMVIYSGTSPTGGFQGTYLAVVRVGDLVVIVDFHADGSGDQSYVVQMAQTAVAKL